MKFFIILLITILTPFLAVQRTIGNPEKLLNSVQRMETVDKVNVRGKSFYPIYEKAYADMTALTTETKKFGTLDTPVFPKKTTPTTTPVR